MCALEMATCARAGVRLQPHANWRVLPGALTQEHGGGHRPRLLEQLLLAIKAHALELIHWQQQKARAQQGIFVRAGSLWGHCRVNVYTYLQVWL
jgi:hypothetical protein